MARSLPLDGRHHRAEDRLAGGQVEHRQHRAPASVAPLQGLQGAAAVHSARGRTSAAPPAGRRRSPGPTEVDGLVTAEGVVERRTELAGGQVDDVHAGAARDHGGPVARDGVSLDHPGRGAVV